MLEIKCDSYQLSEVPNIDAFNSRDDFYKYEDAVRCQYTVAQGSDCIDTLKALGAISRGISTIS